MIEILLDFKHVIAKWFHSLKNWKKRGIITLIVLSAISWILVISHINEWWNWSEWMLHIKEEHM